jgi:DNL zinc finger
MSCLTAVNFSSVGSLSDRNGVVIALCKGCETRHIIADNLGWTDYKGGFQEEKNIEEFLANRGDDGNQVHRVTPEVFQLAEVFARDTSSGAIVGADGEPAME